jgi:NADPH2:quinone reductase
MMKALVIDQFGGSNIFREADLPIPLILPHHVLIRVAATSINPVDLKIRQGLVADITPALPAVLHGDVAGTVKAVGVGVNDFQVGDEVYACAGGVKGLGGALAEYMLVDANLACGGTKWFRMLILQRVWQFVVKEKEHSFATSSI